MLPRLLNEIRMSNGLYPDHRPVSDIYWPYVNGRLCDRGNNVQTWRRRHHRVKIVTCDLPLFQKVTFLGKVLHLSHFLLHSTSFPGCLALRMTSSWTLKMCFSVRSEARWSLVVRWVYSCRFYHVNPDWARYRCFHLLSSKSLSLSKHVSSLALVKECNTHPLPTYMHL